MIGCAAIIIALEGVINLAQQYITEVKFNEFRPPSWTNVHSKLGYKLKFSYNHILNCRLLRKITYRTMITENIPIDL